ncbi:hypothetical protein O7626_26235 [Micromonospora sp. WMMD1102]|uniref:hypothetical protein n=1 Tax=Micromonospora sp. WMMD1102 TaxID=3016105 RepID=UPI0024151F51|nr:hypothetical protein [Micromonospora sp. WMMD1102]MDG4789381.1 hypothetical protein [Micromonospora sp. WMMD1102]
MRPISRHDFRRAVRDEATRIAVARKSRTQVQDWAGPEPPPPTPTPTPTPTPQPERRRNDQPDSRREPRRDGWNGPTWAHLANGRAGDLTPAQQDRARHAERV